MTNVCARRKEKLPTNDNAKQLNNNSRNDKNQLCVYSYAVYPRYSGKPIISHPGVGL